MDDDDDDDDDGAVEEFQSFVEDKDSSRRGIVGYFI